MCSSKFKKKINSILISVAVKIIAGIIVGIILWRFIDYKKEKNIINIANENIERATSLFNNNRKGEALNYLRENLTTTPKRGGLKVTLKG